MLLSFAGELGVGHTNTLGDDETMETFPACAGAAECPAVSTFPLPVAGTLTSPLIVSGPTHTAAVYAGRVVTWGDGSNGALGYGDRESVGDNEEVRLERRVNLGQGFADGVAQVALGRHFSCALSTTGLVKCWGLADHGQTGTGSTQTTTQPPVSAVQLRDRTVKIVTSSSNVCALSEFGRVTCW